MFSDVTELRCGVGVGLNAVISSWQRRDTRGSPWEEEGRGGGTRPQPRDTWSPWELEEAGRPSPWRLWREYGPADMSVSDMSSFQKVRE